MIVKELIEHLQKLDQDAVVLTAVDDEGNGYNKVYYVPSEWLYTSEGRVYNIYPAELKELMEHCYIDEEEAQEMIDGYELCVVI